MNKQFCILKQFIMGRIELYLGDVRRSPTQALTSLEARVTSYMRKHTEKFSSADVTSSLVTV